MPDVQIELQGGIRSGLREVIPDPGPGVFHQDADPFSRKVMDGETRPLGSVQNVDNPRFRACVREAPDKLFSYYWPFRLFLTHGLDSGLERVSA